MLMMVMVVMMAVAVLVVMAVMVVAVRCCGLLAREALSSPSFWGRKCGVADADVRFVRPF